MEIDIFPIPHRKDGIARNFDKGFLGILIISYIIAALRQLSVLWAMMQKMGILLREGNTSAGHWVVINRTEERSSSS